MAALFQFPFFMGFPVLPAKRVIAVDAGSHSIKILLVESFRRRIRILRQQSINLAEEGLLSAEELGPHLRGILDDLGPHPIALSLPQHIALSQLVDLPPAEVEGGVRNLIEEQTFKHGDLRDSQVVYNFAPLRAFGRHQNAFWVTLCKETDVFAQIQRLAVPEQDVCDVVSAASVLLTAYQAIEPRTDRTILVDIGATSTLLTIVIDNQSVFSGTFPIGGNLFTETVANQKKCSIEAAETLKRTKNLLSGPDALSSLVPVVESWRQELERIASEWLRDHAELKLSLNQFRMVLSGGGSLQPGFVDYLNHDQRLKFSSWPKISTEGGLSVSRQFGVAYGTALAALGTSTQSTSLLPTRLREAWSKERVYQRVLSACFFLLIATAVLLATGTWRKLSVARHKQSMLTEAQIALEKINRSQVLEKELLAEYERVRPIAKRQQQTIDTLKTLSLLDQTHTNRNVWYVLFADQQSYFLGQTGISTNPLAPATATSTNLPPNRGFVTELCVAEEGDAMRKALSQVVGELKAPFFTNVDTLPADRRRNLANPKVLVPERHFAVVMDLAGDDFQAPLLPQKVPQGMTNTTARPIEPRNTNQPTNRRMIIE